MARTTTPVCEFGHGAAAFDLPGVDGRRHTLDSARGSNGLLVMFLCNHCPFVKAVLDRIVRDTAELAGHGIGSIAIMANDPSDYPEDSWENMVRIARERAFPFPYVLDRDQSVARAYGAVCTPDFFLYDAQGLLAYRGAFDASSPKNGQPRTGDLLRAAIADVQAGRPVPEPHRPAMGCGIKWKQS